MPLAHIPTVSPPASTVPANTKIGVDLLPSGEAIQYLKLMDGTFGQQTVAKVGASGLEVEVKAMPTVTITGQGLAGTPAGGVVTVQGAPTGGTPLPVSGTFWPAVATTDVGTVRIKDSNGGDLVRGQQLMVASLPVVLASNQSAVPIQGGQVAGTAYPNNVVTVQGAVGAVPIPISGSITTTAGPADKSTWMGGTPVTPPGFLVDEAATLDVVTENQLAAARVNLNRAQVMVIEDTAGPGTGKKAVVAGGSLQVSIGAVGTLPDTVPTATPVGLGVASFLYGRDPADSNFDLVKLGVAATAIPASTPGVLYVQGIGANGAVTVSGTVATTNALADASLGVIDDWDENDRAKVNPIAGQVGVQGASGAVTALTQRVVLATDVALPAGSNAIGKLAPNSGVVIGDVNIPTGQVAIPLWGHGANGANNPDNSTQVGAEVQLAEPAVLGAGVLAALVADKVGKLLVLPYSLPENLLQANVFCTAAATPTPIIAAQAAGIRIYITSLTIVNQHATVSTLVTLFNGGAEMWYCYAAAAGGGVTVSFPTPLATSAATALNFVTAAAANVLVSVTGYKGR